MPDSPEPPVNHSSTQAKPDRRYSHSWLPVGLCLALIAVVTLALFVLSDYDLNGTERIQGPHVADPEPVEPRITVSQNPGYLGPEACAECHQERVSEFRRTKHFRTCRIPAADELPSQFHTGANVYSPRFAGTRFEMIREGEQFFQTTVTTVPSGETRHASRIDLVLGAGNADDVYVTWHDDGRMYELPIAWLWPSETWGASHFLTPFGTGDFSRAMTVRCMECHNTWMDYEAGSVNRYQHGTELLGVTCERCHGPGKAHVRHHRLNPQESTAVSIIKPSELDRERLIETCTQCHSNAIAHRRPPFTYQPGHSLDEYFRTLAIQHPEDDHVANQIDDLRKSKCFQGSQSMTCITCHDPHGSRPPGESLATACRQCHQPEACEERPRLPQPVQDDCVGCHMPRRIKINVKFETERDNFVPPTSRSQHRIAIDHVARDEVLLEWHRSGNSPDHRDAAENLTNQLQQHWTGQAEQHRGQHRFLAAIAAYREALAVRETEQVRNQLQDVVNLQKTLYDDWAAALNEISRNRPQAAIGKLKTILQAKPDDAEAHSKLGTLYAITGQTDLAVPHLEAVQKHDRNNGSGYGVLGRIAWRKGEYEQALKHWQQAEELDPFNAQIQLDTGLAFARLRRTEEAIRSLERAAMIDPIRSDIRVSLEALRSQSSRIPDR